MTIDLKKTDVVIIGVGAVGGVAALPLTRAGLEVVGLEAGSWLTPRDFAPDELRNNFRGWPQSSQKANNEIPTHRPNVSAPYSTRFPIPYSSPQFPIHPMMNAVRRHLAALLGAELATQPVGLQSGERDKAALRRLAHPAGLDGRGLAVRA
jgi:choline dehydrogenase-like flavoprotein